VSTRHPPDEVEEWKNERIEWSFLEIFETHLPEG
jgi:hypothetical protein